MRSGTRSSPILEPSRRSSARAWAFCSTVISRPSLLERAGAVAEPADLDVLAIGNALVDVLTHADDERVTKLGLVKGTMSLVDEAQARALYEAMGPGVEISGGSAANTIVGVASFGGRAQYVGKVRDDQLGEVFGHDLRSTGVLYET